MAEKPYIPRDYRSPRDHRKPGRDWFMVPRRMGLGASLLTKDIARTVGLKGLAVIALVVGAFVVIPVLANVMTTGDIAARRATVPLALPDATAALDEADDRQDTTDHWKTLEVKSGQSLAKLFKSVGLGPRVVYELVRLDEYTAKLNRVYPGQILRVHAVDGRLDGLEFEIDETQRVRVERGPEGLESRVLSSTIERRIVHADGEIDDSLFLSGQRAGLTDKAIMDLATIFGWDIDFVLDIRKGDRFSLIYEDLYRDGEKLRTGDILAATFINRGKAFHALRYERADGQASYYTPEGRNMRKAFLKSPLDITRVTSRFTLKRYHPVLKINRPHRGVDYGARVGTPVRATGDGKVVMAGKARGYGNHVIIQHANQYKTLYAHLSRFGKGVRNGARVRQGQIIAYSGKTGLVSGPHLHYEFRVNNRHVDPLRVKLPAAKSLAKTELERFRLSTKTMMAQLEMLEARAVAVTGP